MIRIPFALLFIATAVLACSWDWPIWIPRSESADPLYRFVKKGRAGYIDRTGKVIIAPTLKTFGNSAEEFHDGILALDSDGSYIDRQGKPLATLALQRGWDFSEGLAVAMKRDEKLWGYIDTSGKFAISPRFESSETDYVYPFSDGLAMIKVKGTFGYIDRAGQFQIQPQFLTASSFSNGAAKVVLEGPCHHLSEGPCGSPRSIGGEIGFKSPKCKFNYIDKEGHVISTVAFDAGRNFAEGLAPVQQGQFWGFIDLAGRMVILPTFEDAEPFSSGLARIRENSLFGYADKSGKIVIPARFRFAESFHDGFAPVGEEGRYWYIDEKGSRAPFGEFAAASPFFKGIAHVQLLSSIANAPPRFAYIDKKGRTIFKY